MSQQKAKAAAQFPLSVSPPELWRLEFQRPRGISAQNPEPSETQLSTGLAISRLAPEEIGVELAFEMPELSGGSLAVAYRARFRVTASEQVEDLEATLQEVAANVAPRVLYPFVREAVTSLMGRAGLPAFSLPMLDFREIFPVDETEVPAFDDE